MAIYWHPFLVQMLRWDYGSLLDVYDEVPLGEMPRRADLLLVRRDPTAALPFPFCHLGQRTLVQYKGPDDTADQDAMVKLLENAFAFQCREQSWLRADHTLWLVASRFAGTLFIPGGAEMQDSREAGPGVTAGTVDGFPFCLVDLGALPVGKETLALLMVSRGGRERAMVEYVVEHAAELPEYLQLLLLLHPEVLVEVLVERQLTPEEIGIQRERLLSQMGPGAILRSMDVSEIIKVIGLDEIVRSAGLDEIVRSAGLDEIVRSAGLDEIVRSAGTERVLQALERVREGRNRTGPARPAEN